LASPQEASSSPLRDFDNSLYIDFLPNGIPEPCGISENHPADPGFDAADEK
jgi:hypothetical protein